MTALIIIVLIFYVALIILRLFSDDYKPSGKSAATKWQKDKDNYDDFPYV